MLPERLAVTTVLPVVNDTSITPTVWPEVEAAMSDCTEMTFEPETIKSPAGLLKLISPLEETEAASVKRVAPSQRYTFEGVESAETPVLFNLTAVTVPLPMKLK